MLSARSVLLLPLLVVADWTYDENVAVLDPDNFDAFISSQEYTIVEARPHGI